MSPFRRTAPRPPRALATPRLPAAAPTGACLLAATLTVALAATLAAAITTARPAAAASFPTTRDAVLVAAGGATGLAGLLLSPDMRAVPQQGLDPRDIRWGLDRRSLAAPRLGALRSSDAFRLGTLLYPVVTSFAAPGPQGQGKGAIQTLRVQGEAVLLATGLTLLLKDATARARPFAYAAQEDLPRSSFYDTSEKGAFASLPSGHASTTWASSMAAIGLLATRRPELPRGVHFLNGMLAAGLATATSLLRVEAQAHFPTDVAAGSLIGAGSGIAVTLLHAEPAPAGSRRGRAWAYGLGGMAAGVALGVLLTPPTSPWIR